MCPFVLAGGVAGKAYKLKKQHSVFLFFPSADIGGAIKVNADITNCIKDSQPLVIFSKKPKNNQFRELFNIEGVTVLDLHKYIDNKLYHFVNFFFRGVLASWINSANKPIVFGGESLYFYKIVPHVKKETRCIELCHLNTWFDFSQAFVKYLDLRIFSTPKIKRDVEKQYAENGVPENYLQRLRFVDNKIDIPPKPVTSNQHLEVIYVGRGAPQKRVYLIAEIAKEIREKRTDIHFSFVGDVNDLIPDDVKTYCTLHGNVNDPEVLRRLYDNADVLILTSKYEGLPLVVMDMMARGKVVLSTAVDGIPDYITHMENGLLIYDTEEDEIVASGVQYLNLIAEDKALAAEIGKKSYEYAVEHFGGEKFCGSYRKFLLQENS